MPTWAKVVFIVGGLGLLLLVGTVGAGIYWWLHNKDALIAKGRAQMEEGDTAGRATDNRGCMDQSVARYKAQRAFSNAIATALFARACLESSRPTPGFCDDVPKENEFIKSSQWSEAQCQRVELGSDQYCQQIFGVVQEFCESPSRLKPANSQDQTPNP